MDPFTALGVATNVIAIVDFSTRLISKCKEAYDAVHGQSQKIKDTEYLTSGLNDALQRLEYQNAQSSRYCAMSPLRNGAEGEKELHAMSEACCKIGKRLLDQMAQLQGTRDGRLDRIKGIWRYFRFSKDIDETSARLNDYKQQLEMHVIFSIRREVLDQVAHSQEYYTRFEAHEVRIIDALRRGEATLARLETSIHSLHGAIVDDGERTRQLLRNLHTTKRLGIDDDESNKLHRSLLYEGWNHRQADVATAHAGTLRWILTDPDQGRWPSLLAWLNGDDNHAVYWITGKPGSGKSTMMKWLAEVVIPTHFAHKSDVIIISHFFWDLGPKIQKTISGMLRSVLFQLLQQRPALKDRLFQDLHLVYESSGIANHPEPDRWTKGLLTKAIKHCIQSLDRSSIFLILDGLDECSDDHDELCQVLQPFLALGRDRIFMLAASRTWEVFKEFFGKSEPASVLYLHSYTASDILRYVTDNFHEIDNFRRMSRENPQSSENLVSLLNDRAQGVWVWVRLAVNRVRKLIRIGKYDIGFLREEVAQLPEELGRLYDHIVSRLEPAVRSDCAALLLLRIPDYSAQVDSADAIYWLAYQLWARPHIDENDYAKSFFARSADPPSNISAEDITGGLLEWEYNCDGFPGVPSMIHLTAYDWMLKESTISRLADWIPDGMKRVKSALLRSELALTCYVSGDEMLDYFEECPLRLASTFFKMSLPSPSELALINQNLSSLHALFCLQGDFIDNKHKSADGSEICLDLIKYWFDDHIGLETIVWSVFDTGSIEPGIGVAPLARACRDETIILCTSELFAIDVASRQIYHSDMFRSSDLSIILILEILSCFGDYYVEKDDCILALLDAGANPNLSLKPNGCTSWACWLIFIDAFMNTEEEPDQGEVQVIKRLFAKGAEPLTSLRLPFRRLRSDSRVPLASEYLTPRCLRWLASLGIYQGHIPSEQKWSQRIKDEGWAEHPCRLHERREAWHLNALSPRPLHKWYDTRPQSLTPHQSVKTLDMQEYLAKAKEIIRERDEKCRPIIRRIVAEQSCRP